MPEEKSKVAPIAGLALTAAGLAHFVRPQLFEGITASAFPTDTSRHLQTNGGIETAIGLGLLVPQTRRLAVLGSVGYVVYLAANVIKNS